MPKGKCTWLYYAKDYYKTKCGSYPYVHKESGDPKYLGWKFCPLCGRKMQYDE